MYHYPSMESVGMTAKVNLYLLVKGHFFTMQVNFVWLPDECYWLSEFCWMIYFIVDGDIPYIPRSASHVFCTEHDWASLSLEAKMTDDFCKYEKGINEYIILKWLNTLIYYIQSWTTKIHTAPFQCFCVWFQCTTQTTIHNYISWLCQPLNYACFES